MLLCGCHRDCLPFYLHYQSSLTLRCSPVVPASKCYTVAIIKPDAVAHGKSNEIIMKVHRGQQFPHSDKIRWSRALLLTLVHYPDISPLGQIQDAGFEILAQEERTLTESEAQDFYQHKAAEVWAEPKRIIRKMHVTQMYTMFMSHYRDWHASQFSVCLWGWSGRRAISSPCQHHHRCKNHFS